MCNFVLLNESRLNAQPGFYSVILVQILIDKFKLPRTDKRHTCMLLFKFSQITHL